MSNTTTRAARRVIRAQHSLERANRAMRAAYRGNNWHRQAGSLDACNKAYAHLQLCLEAAEQPYALGVKRNKPTLFTRFNHGLTRAPW